MKVEKSAMPNEEGRDNEHISSDALAEWYAELASAGTLPHAIRGKAAHGVRDRIAAPRLNEILASSDELGKALAALLAAMATNSRRYPLLVAIGKLGDEFQEVEQIIVHEETNSLDVWILVDEMAVEREEMLIERECDIEQAHMDSRISFAVVRRRGQSWHDMLPSDGRQVYPVVGFD